MIRFFTRFADGTALLVLSVLTYRLQRNLRFLQQVKTAARRVDPSPRVSILVPARNESCTIVHCIESLVQQNYPVYEVIVLNDQSSDNTGELLDELASRYSNLTVIHSSGNLLAGWNGKSYACHRLAAHATGEWLLFTDADTLHMPTSVAQGIAQASTLDADLLSAFPRQITESWGECIVVSFIIDFLPLIGIDLTQLWRGTSRATAANGQYLLVRASAYWAVGGHEAIGRELVDDFALAKRFRLCGFRVALVDGTSMLRCRMYRSAAEVWAGFSKNILLGMEATSGARRSRGWSLLFAWAYACIFVLPFLRLLFSGRLLPLLEISWLMALRQLVNHRFVRPRSEVITTPLAAWSVMALGLGALLRRRRGASIRWKGRDYPLTR